MLPSLPPTEPDAPISGIRFLTGELHSLLSAVVSWTGLRGPRSSPVSRQRSSPRLPSLDRVPARSVPRRPQYYGGATTSRSRIPSHLFVSLPGPTLTFVIRVSQLALPGAWRTPSGPGSLFNR